MSISNPCLCNENRIIKSCLVLPGVNFGENHFYSSLLNGKKSKASIKNATKMHNIYLMLLMCGDLESCPGPALFGNASDSTILQQNVCGLAS